MATLHSVMTERTWKDFGRLFTEIPHLICAQIFDRFWKRGYWSNHLGNRRYHIRFVCVSLKQVYQSLSKLNVVPCMLLIWYGFVKWLQVTDCEDNIRLPLLYMHAINFLAWEILDAKSRPQQPIKP